MYFCNMEPPDKRITKFINQHHLMSLSMAVNDQAWSCSCFFIFMGESVEFLIASDEHTKHIEFAKKNHSVSGTIALETKAIGKIRGIQFTGKIQKVEKENYRKYKIIYLKKFPLAVLNSTDLWLIKTDLIKMTDNRLGFGKKIYWHRP